jgi:hypothetical protein
MRRCELPVGRNILVSVPMMASSFMYGGVHNLRYAKTRYGTVEDPEYLLVLMKPWTLPLFIVVSRWHRLRCWSVCDPVAALALLS